MENKCVCCDEKIPPGIFLNLWKFWTQKRFIVAFMVCLSEMNLYIVRTCLSIAIVSMTAVRSVRNEEGLVVQEPEFDWDSKQQGIILSAFFYGYIVTQVPGGMIAAQYGAHRVSGIGVAVSCLLTFLTPLFAQNFHMLIFIRVAEGMLTGTVFPANTAILAMWATPLERTRMNSLAFSGGFLGTVIALLGSGYLGHHFGWPSIFYVFGAFGMIWYAFWVYLVAESPKTDKKITEVERKFIIESIGSPAQNTKNMKMPWKQILLSVPVWGIACAHFTENWGIDTLLTQMPTYLSDTMNLRLDSNGFLSCLPYLVLTILTNIGGHLADMLLTENRLSTTQVRKSFTSVGFVFQSGFMLLAAYFQSAEWCIFGLVMSIGFAGFAFSGFAVNHMDLSPQHCGILFGISNTVASIPGVVSPMLTGFLVQNKESSEWQNVFYIAAAIYLIGALLYWCTASGELQPWATQISTKKTMDNCDSEDETAIRLETFREPSCTTRS